MGSNNTIFNNSRVGRILLKFAIPSIISLLVLELYNMVDTVFVGRYIGPNAIGALTIAFPIQRFIIAVGMLISIGASTRVARSLGEKNMKALKDTIINAFVLTTVTLITVCFIIFLFRKNLIAGFGANGEIFSLANKYVSIILIGGVFQCLFTVACYIMTALGNTKVTLYANIIGTLMNLVINYILVAIFDIGVSGAAIATIVSQIAAFIYSMHKFREVNRYFNLKFDLKNVHLSFNKTIMFSIAAIGFSTFITEISDAVVSVVLNHMLSVSGGDEAIIIIGVTTRISMFIFVTLIGISSGMQPIIAYYYGAGNFQKMRETLKKAIQAISAATMVFWVTFMVFTKQIIGFFLEDTSLLADAVTAFRICISLMPLLGIYYICIYYYQATKEPRKSFLLSIYGQIILLIPIAAFLIQLIGVTGAWLAYPISHLITFITSIYFIRKALSAESIEEQVVPEKIHA
ncbi:MATE family efflux transporter [Clostridium oryzae]|uniref:Multidrug export protein MepA n=1 Tax=Clostridium oryzae TaxID=1450648 RepID=A0A1V4IBP0_9CLOT|nr:MATE family efflux transporter [Clostridium oryzae]OPJ57418.1 multidrug export protein MepA [Clostridium oryzae]